jgi:hypothetical protein
MTRVLSDEVPEVRSSVYKINATIPNRWYSRSMVEGGIALSLIALAIILLTAPQVAYGVATQFSFGTFNHTGLEKQTRAFLDDSQQKDGPPIFTLSPQKARTVLSGLQASVAVKMLAAMKLCLL